MTKPGILLGYSGLFNAIKRLDEIEIDRKTQKTDSNEAKLMRTCCETLFWLFAVNEDFKSLIEDKLDIKIHQWWNEKGDVGKMMNGFRFIRNRVTHTYKYYWEIIDIENSKWNIISKPTDDELTSSTAKKYILQQYSDYNSYIKGSNLTDPLKKIADEILETMVKFNLNKWT